MSFITNQLLYEMDNSGISTYVNRLYADNNVYDNNIAILTNQFLSPVADAAPTFYRFYIRDTVEADGIKLIRLNFTPRNTNDLLFRGTLYVTLDGNYAVQKLNMSISKNANLNWTRELHIKQDFEKALMAGTICRLAICWQSLHSAKVHLAALWENEPFLLKILLLISLHPIVYIKQRI